MLFLIIIYDLLKIVARSGSTDDRLQPYLFLNVAGQERRSG